MTADPEYSTKLAQEEEKSISTKEASLSEANKLEIVKQAEELKAYQEKFQVSDCLCSVCQVKALLLRSVVFIWKIAIDVLFYFSQKHCRVTC